MYRSTMKCIQLLAVLKSSVLQAYGADCVLENIMKDVKQLEQVNRMFIINESDYRYWILLTFMFRMLVYNFSLVALSTVSVGISLSFRGIISQANTLEGTKPWRVPYGSVDSVWQ